MAEDRFICHSYAIPEVGMLATDCQDEVYSLLVTGSTPVSSTIQTFTRAGLTESSP